MRKQIKRIVLIKTPILIQELLIRVKNFSKFLNENKLNKLDAFYRLRNMRETGAVDNELGYSREFWKWLDSVFFYI